jgi:hypothetical protein
MSVTLDSNLQTALDGDEHHPICKIISKSPRSSDYPFVGNYFNQDSTVEYAPTMICLNTGRLIIVYRKGNDLYLAYSDIDRTTWTHTLLYNGDSEGNPAIYGNSVIELSNGNLGIVFICFEGSTCYLKSMVVSPTGSVITAAANIATSATGTAYWKWPTLCAISGGFLCIMHKWTVGTTTSDLYKRTCDTNFANWTSESLITISGINHLGGSDAYLDYHYPELIRSSAGTIFLYYTNIDDFTSSVQYISNIFVSISTNDGSTWGAAAQITNYTAEGTRAQHPSAQIKSTGDMYLTFQEIKDVLFIRDSTPGFCGDTGHESFNIHFDEVSRTLFVTKGQTGMGTKQIICVLAIDVDTWTIENCYNHDTSSPKYSALYYDNGSTWYKDYIMSGYNGTVINDDYWITLINNQAETMTEYNFNSYAAYSVVKTVDWDIYAFYSWPIALSPDCTFLDTVNDRLWVALRDSYSTSHYLEVGYIDITEQPDPITGLYTWHTHFHKYQSLPLYHWMGRSGAFRVFPSEGKIVCCGQQSYSNLYGHCRVYNYTTGSEIKYYHNTTNSGFHYRGMLWPIIHNNKLYGSFPYESSYGQSERRGLMIVDMDDDSVRYRRPITSGTPDFATRDDYGLWNLELIDEDTDSPRILMRSFDGIAIYDINSDTWDLFNSTNVPGWEENGYGLAYDPVNDTIFGTHTRVQAFQEDGSFQNHYMYDGTYQGTAANFSYSNLTKLTTFSEAYEGDIALDEDDVVWFTWAYDDVDLGSSLLWDRASFSPEIQDFLIAGTPVKIDWEAEKYTKATFTLARGDLFDPTNLNSIYAPTMLKGRMVDIYYGEQVGANNYWQLQGEFFVIGSRTSYDKKNHPQITIEAEDPSTFWDEYVVTATEAFTDTSIGDVLVNLMQDFMAYVATDYVVPTFDNLHGLYTQWVDVSMEDIMADIDTHFGCFRHWGVDRKLRWKQIDLTGSIDHTYSGLTKIWNYQPSDKYSSFINAVIVKCEGINPFEVLWDEESIGNLDGTLGWWSKEDTIRFYYNEDQTRQVRHPRLEKIQSIKDFSPLLTFLGGADEYISYEDPDETFLDITIEGPDRALYVFAFAASTVALGVAAIGCDADWSCGVSIMLTNLSLGALIEALSAVASYRYIIHGRPIGHELETYQGRWDDTEFQTFMGGIEIPYEFDDPLSYTVQHCTMVATQEGTMLMAQRNRITFEKTAHLQDELGDIIQIQHPISLQNLKFFIAKLSRTFTKPKVGSSGGGKFTDTIDGWRIT